MARAHVFSTDTKLWHPAEGWRVFPAGETNPGGSWHEKEGGDSVGSNAASGALKDLIEANDRLDHMAQMMASKDHDLGVMGRERDAAVGKVHDLEQRAIAAEKAKAEAEESARGYMLERDQARAELSRAKAKAADLSAQVEELTAPPAKAAKTAA